MSIDLDAIRVGDHVRVTFTRDDNREHAEITGNVVATTRVGLDARDSIRIHPHGDHPGSIRIYDDGSVVGVEPGDRLDVVLGNRAEIHRIDDGQDGEPELVADGGQELKPPYLRADESGITENAAGDTALLLVREDDERIEVSLTDDDVGHLRRALEEFSDDEHDDRDDNRELVTDGGIDRDDRVLCQRCDAFSPAGESAPTGDCAAGTTANPDHEWVRPETYYTAVEDLALDELRREYGDLSEQHYGHAATVDTVRMAALWNEIKARVDVEQPKCPECGARDWAQEAGGPKYCNECDYHPIVPEDRDLIEAIDAAWSAMLSPDEDPEVVTDGGEEIASFSGDIDFAVIEICWGGRS